MVTSLSERLKERMKDLDIHAAELARKVGIKPASASLWLDGTTKSIKGANLLKAAAALQVTPDWLASGMGRKFLDQSNAGHVREPETAYGDPQINEAVVLLKGMSPDARKEALSFLKIFAAKKGGQKPRRQHIPVPAHSKHAA